jgi:Domain of unknown function (DUF4194)
MDHPQHGPAPYAAVAIKLLLGPIYDTQTREWSDIKLYFNDLSNYLGKIGLELVFNETEGYAYLSQSEPEDEASRLPRLLQRRKLSWEVTLLCVLLRQKLEEFDVQDTSSRKLFITRGEFKAEIELFFPDQNNQSRLLERLDTLIRNVQDLGYIERINQEDPSQPDATRYEVKRIIKARFTADELQAILRKIKPEESHAGIDIQE